MSRPEATVPTWPSTSRAHGTSGSPSPTEPTSTRWTRPPSTAGLTSSSSTSPASAPRLTGQPTGRSASGLFDRDGHPRESRCPRPDPAALELRSARWPPSRRLKPIRVLFENGAGAGPGRSPTPALSSPSPVPGARDPRRALVSRRWRTLRVAPVKNAGADRFTWNPARPPGQRTSPAATTVVACGRPPRVSLDSESGGTAVAYVTAQLRANTVVIGGGAVQLWLKSSARTVDLQVTITEVRPDGKETFVQNGWLRANERRLGPGLEHAARAGPEPAGPRRARPAPRPLRQGHRAPVLRGPRLPSRGTHPDRRLGAGWRPARLGASPRPSLTGGPR